MTNTALCSALPIADTAAPPKWLHLLPAGEARTLDGRGPYRIGNATALIAASMAAGKLVLDENHATDLAAPKGLPAPARGWIVALEQRGDGIWGKVQWTDDAARSQPWRSYRGVSPVIVHKADGEVLSIARASLTNTPNLTGLATLHHSGATMNIRNQLAGIAGVPVDSNADTILDKLRFMLKEEDDKAKAPQKSAHAAASDLAIQARAHVKKMADAGVTVDFCTAVRQVQNGTAA